MANTVELLNDLEISYNELNSIPTDIQVILNQEIENRNPKALSIRNWYNDLTDAYQNFKTEINAGNISNFTFDDIGPIPYSLISLYDSVKENKISNYRISSYVDVNFIDDRIHLVDFKRHLKPNVALSKKTYRSVDGRPSHNEYYYDDVYMARISFIFESDENNLLTHRVEKLQYVKNDGTLGSEVVIKNKYYDKTNPSDAALIVAERVRARTYIVESLNVFILGVLSNYHATLSQNEIIDMIITYWDSCEADRRKFIELGMPQWKNSIAAIDIENPPTGFEWMAYVIDADGTTIRDYAYNILNY